MIHVIAVITAKPGQRETLLAHFHANLPAVRAEKGCLEYGAAIDADTDLRFQAKCGSDCVIVVEKWENLEALRAHSAAPHMVAFSGKTKEFVASRAIHILQPA